MDLQRLFSTFAAGWPGIGLLLQRVLTAIVLLHYGNRYFMEAPQSAFKFLHLIGAGAGIFLLVGLWTPVVAALVAIVEISTIFFHGDDPWISLILAMLGVTLAMIGPGAWSIDARLFGRKHLAS